MTTTDPVPAWVHMADVPPTDEPYACPVCGATERLAYAPGDAVPIIGCGNPWHYTELRTIADEPTGNAVAWIVIAVVFVAGIAACWFLRGAS